MTFEPGRVLYRLAFRVWEVLRHQNRGTPRTTRRTVLVHLLTHPIRHYARLATADQKQGVAPDWHKDYILMQMRR